MSKPPVFVIGHVDHGRTTLAAAIARALAKAEALANADTSPQPVNETPKTEQVAGTSEAEGER